MREITCSLCGSGERRPVAAGRDHAFPQNQRSYTLHQCAGCGLIYLSPRPETAEELAEIYPAAYSPFVKEGQRLFSALRRAAWRPEIREIARLTSPESHILELGCATGEFLAELRRAGRPNLLGLDLSAQAARAARERHGLEVRSGDLLDAGLPDRSVDLVVMRHVLEHVPDPRATLAEITRILRPGGRCVFTIPNVDSHTFRIFGDDWYGLDIPRHFHLFPRRTLAMLISAAGLRGERLIYVATPNVWIGSVRFWLAERGAGRLARFFTYQNPLALALFAPLGLLSAALRSSGVVRVIVQRPTA